MEFASRTEDIIWLAALLEGEGHFALARKTSPLPSPVIRLKMADRDVVERAARIMGGKYVAKRAAPRPEWSDLYHTALSGHPALDLLREMRPYLGHRRGAKADSMLASDYAATVRRADSDLCKRGHPLAGDNLYITPHNGHRQCKQCRRDRNAGHHKDPT